MSHSRAYNVQQRILHTVFNSNSKYVQSTALPIDCPGNVGAVQRVKRSTISKPSRRKGPLHNETTECSGTPLTARKASVLPIRTALCNAVNPPLPARAERSTPLAANTSISSDGKSTQTNQQSTPASEVGHAVRGPSG